MEFTSSHTFDAPVEAVWIMFCDPAAHVAKFEGMGHREVEVLEHENDVDSFRLVISRVVDTELPGFAKKVLKPTNTVVTTDTWQADGSGGYGGEFTAEAKGAPVEVKGTTHITSADGGTLYTIATDVNVKVPLIGGKISNWAAGTTKEQIQMEFDAGDRWLAEHT